MAAMGPPPYISAAEVARLVSYSDLAEAMEKALVQSSDGDKGGVVQPVRTTIPVKDRGMLLCMPAYAQQSNSLAVKLLSVFPGNKDVGIPIMQGIIVVMDAATGALQALVEVEHLSAMRTAAASVCAIKALSSVPPAILCVVGTGVEARSHIQACRDILDFQEIRIWGRNMKNAEKCAEDVGGAIAVLESLEKAVRGADVVVTVTMAKEPLVCGRWLKPGAIVCGVGACQPENRELDDELMHNAVITVDTVGGANQESGDIILSKAEIYAEIGEIISGSKPLPKVPDCGKKYYLFKSLGMAVEDALSGKLLYDRYIQEQKGTQRQEKKS